MSGIVEFEPAAGRSRSARPSWANSAAGVVDPPGGGRRERLARSRRPRFASGSAGSSSTSSNRSRSQAAESAAGTARRGAAALSARVGSQLAGRAGRPRRDAAPSAGCGAVLPASGTCRAMRPSICCFAQQRADEAAPPRRAEAGRASRAPARRPARRDGCRWRVSNPLVTALNLCSSASTAPARAVAGTRRFHASNKITRIESFWQGQNPQIDLIFFEQCQQRIDEFRSCGGGRHRRRRARA